MAILSKSSLVFSVSWELFLTKKLQYQKNMCQINIKETTAHLGSYTFLKEMLINIKNVTFTALSTTNNGFFTEHLSLATFVLWILQSF